MENRAPISDFEQFLRQLAVTADLQDAGPLPQLADEDHQILTSLAFSVASEYADDDQQTQGELLADAVKIFVRRPEAIRVYRDLLDMVTELDKIPAPRVVPRHRRPLVASVRRSGNGLQWAGRVPSRALRPTELARSRSDAVSEAVSAELQFTEHLSGCELEIQLAPHRKTAFRVLVRVSSCSYGPPDSAVVLRLRSAERGEPWSHDAALENAVAEFVAVPAGNFELLVLQKAASGALTEVDGIALSPAGSL